MQVQVIASDEVLASDEGRAIESIEVLISYALWNQWAEIAIERESAAREARGLLVAQHRYERQFAESLSAELLAAIGCRTPIVLTCGPSRSESASCSLPGSAVPPCA